MLGELNLATLAWRGGGAMGSLGTTENSLRHTQAAAAAQGSLIIPVREGVGNFIQG